MYKKIIISPLARLLLLSVGFTISLILFRIFYSASLIYLSFVWNLFLAAIPLLVSTALLKAGNKNVQWLLLAVWLLFFPNALYIITDLVHLQSWQPVPLWFDVILIFSAAINGLIMAYISFRHIELFLGTKFNGRKTNMILVACIFLSSFGVYLGRFLRWNSWDVFVDPFGLSADIINNVVNPFQHSRTWEMTVVLTIFFSVFYFTLKKLPATMLKPCK